MINSIIRSAVLILLLLSLWFSIPVRADEQGHPANFIFLIDVSGSMLFKKEMVPGANGEPITLFEALRQSLQQMVNDARLLAPQSKVDFITFGTAITEKTDWPSSLEKPENRQLLSQKISSPEELQADKHGDTYMAGALDRALQKAEAFFQQSEPCTTTFIVMLTDGWDEPPKGATFNIKDVAARIVRKEADLRKKLGVNTLQVRVVGLQRLPDRKAGTTTAAEVASLLGGEFMDVSAQSTGTVAERIYTALNKTIHELEGKVEVATVDKGGVADFGTMQGGTVSTAEIPVISRSCYGEKITGVKDISKSLTDVQKENLKRQFESLKSSGKLKDKDDFPAVTIASELPAGALKVAMPETVLLAPTIDQVSKGGNAWQTMKVIAKVGSNCPPGSYLGGFNLQTTAHCDSLIPYLIAVPSRIFTDADSIRCTAKKTGFIFTKPTTTQLILSIGTSLAGKDMAPEEVVIDAQPAKSTTGVVFDKALINGGKPTTVKLNMSEKASQKVVFNIDVPAEQKPGLYMGKLNITLPGATRVIAPPAVDYILEISASPWEQVSPIAVPIIILLVLVVLLWLVVWIVTKRS